MSSIDDIVIKRTGAIRLSEACHWFGLDTTTALKRASSQSLPVPVFKGKSNKSPWLVKLDDLAQYLNEQYAQHKQEFDDVNAA